MRALQESCLIEEASNAENTFLINDEENDAGIRGKELEKLLEMYADTDQVSPPAILSEQDSYVPLLCDIPERVSYVLGDIDDALCSILDDELPLESSSDIDLTNQEFGFLYVPRVLGDIGDTILCDVDDTFCSVLEDMPSPLRQHSVFQHRENESTRVPVTNVTHNTKIKRR